MEYKEKEVSNKKYWIIAFTAITLLISCSSEGGNDLTNWLNTPLTEVSIGDLLFPIVLIVLIFS